ncbi:MAG: 4Fe-4S dicluster domain-containing protein [Spirochaetaceae bacterium]|nr:MAG: 4Fe-4S dicluster domain-containing protein [Spirochaetaceae bacterium]
MVSAGLRVQSRGSAYPEAGVAKARVVEINVNHQWCKSCGVCIEFCPRDVFVAGERDRAEAVRVEACISCELCERICPDLAITLVYDNGNGNHE